MARSKFKTWLPLDDMAEILGISPLAFNQLSSSTYFPNNTCGTIFFQTDWAHSDRIGRDTIAMAIQMAEAELALEAGYNLMPDWVKDEWRPYPRPAVPEAYNLYGVNPRYQLKSIETKNHGHMICGGIKAKSLIQAGAAIIRTDSDGDGYAETCTITVITSVDVNEIHVYYPGRSGSDEWEVRPIKISMAAGIATITFKSWQVVLGTALEGFNADPLDAELAASYETTVDVYRIYNDPSQQVTLVWENDPTSMSCCNTCVACTLNAQTACFHTRDKELGIIVPSPGTWNASTNQFDSDSFSACREPDQVRLWYYSGYIDHTLDRPYAELANIWKYVIAYFAASKFDKDVCGCSNVRSFVDHWRRDAAYSSQEEGGFTLTAEQAANRLGTSNGALFAHRQLQRPGMRVNK